jgi:MmyB-like transcription regulator ligand binding domain
VDCSHSRVEEAEYDHLIDLALRAARTPPERPIAPGRSVNRDVQLIVEALRPFAAHVISRSHDILAANPAGLRLFAGLDDWPAKERNVSRYVFLHPAARELFDDWDNQVRICVGYFRALAATEPDAPDLTNLVGELLVKSPQFARMWERYDVRGHTLRYPTSATSPSATTSCNLWMPARHATSSVRNTLASWVRERTPSLRYTRPRCISMVFTLRNSCAAISRLVAPPPANLATCSSWTVSASREAPHPVVAGS